MAQTKEGALKVAAKKAAMTFDAYMDKLASGERRCSLCKAWKAISEFGRDRTRSFRFPYAIATGE